MSIETASYPSPQTPGETKQALVDMLATFEDFKQANDARLTEIEQRRSADVLLEDKVTRINDEISRLSAIVQRPALSRAADDTQAESKAAFDAYMRGALDGAEETRASTLTSTANDNSVVIPEHVEQQLEDAVAQRSAFRHLVSETIIESGNALSLIFSKDKAVAAWVSETAARAETDSPGFLSVDIALHEIYSSPTATQRFIDDSDIDVEAWLVEEMAESFAAAENTALVSGTGTNQPKGIAKYTTEATSTGARDTLHVIKSGSASTIQNSRAGEVLLNVAFALPTQFRKNAAWLMNPLTTAKFRSIKDSDGNYLWSPAQSVGDVPHLFGFPAYEDTNIDQIAAAKTAVLFGDFARAYRVVRHRHTTLMRDPFTAKPNVIFYATRRVGGGAINLNATRGLLIGA